MIDLKKITNKICDIIESTKPKYHLKDDVGLYSELCDVLRIILGETRYKKLVELDQITPAIFSDYASGLPYIAIIFPYESDNEKAQAEKLFQVVLKKYLAIHKLNHNILVDWKEHALGIPVIMLRYAETREESEILSRTIQFESQRTVQQFKPPIDEDIDHD